MSKRYKLFPFFLSVSANTFPKLKYPNVLLCPVPLQKFAQCPDGNYFFTGVDILIEEKYDSTCLQMLLNSISKQDFPFTAEAFSNDSTLV